MPHALSPAVSSRHDPVRARSFAELPDGKIARSLLVQIASGQPAPGPRRIDRPLALYGAGNLGRLALRWCERVGVPVDLVVDARANDRQADPFWRGTRVRAPEAVSAESRRDHLLAVCVATSPYQPIEQALRAQGWDDVQPFYDLAESRRDVHPLSNGWFAGALSAGDLQGIGGVLEQWQDDCSRAHHLQFIAWRCLREEWSFEGAPVNEGDRFFIEPVRTVLGEQERFLDVGAHQGEVTERFLALVQSCFQSCALIEPDSASRSALLRRLSALPTATAERIGVLPVAVAEHSGRQRFANGLGYASQLSPLGADEVPVYSLDSLNQAPSFIKLHLEGHEWPVLRGALATLRRERPIIAATLYHNRDGLFATAQWLMSSLPRYRFWLRAHSWCGTGLVVYAIPEERG